MLWLVGAMIGRAITILYRPKTHHHHLSLIFAHEATISTTTVSLPLYSLCTLQYTYKNHSRHNISQHTIYQNTCHRVRQHNIRNSKRTPPVSPTRNHQRYPRKSRTRPCSLSLFLSVRGLCSPTFKHTLYINQVIVVIVIVLSPQDLLYDVSPWNITHCIVTDNMLDYG